MQNEWLAVDGATSPRARARQLRRVWERRLREAEFEGRSLEDVRGPIAESWERSLSAGLDPAGWLAPVDADPAEAEERFGEHPLGKVAAVLLRQLQPAYEASQNLLVVSDANGVLLHVGGDAGLKERAAGEMNFLEGARWSEEAAGTNAVGLALAVDHSVQVFASEHYNGNVHAWTCSAAPVHDPVTGSVVGVVDLTGPMENAHPLSLALAATMATTMEHALADARRELDARLQRRYGDLARTTSDLLVSEDGRLLVGSARSPGAGPLVIPAGGGEIVLDDGSAAVAEPLAGGEAYLVRGLAQRSVRRTPEPLRFEALGRDRALVQLDGRELTLSRRHSEVVVLLAEHAAGLSADELAVALYGDRANPVSARALVSRLRARLGERIMTEPYRLVPPVESDISVLRRLLRQGRVADAAAMHGDVLLPRSEAPGVIELRDELEAWTRRAVMTADDPDALWTWISNPRGAADLPAWVRFLSAVPYEDGRRALAAAHVSRLRRRYAT